MKIKTHIAIATFATMLTAMPLAQASHGHIANYSANGDSFLIKAKVLRVTPVFEYVSFNVPRENCYNQQVTHTRYNNADSASVLLGGIIGSVIGNNIGHGNSRKTNALVGALIGSQIGNGIAAENAYTTNGGYEKRCDTVNVTESRREITHYNVSYRFRGRTMTTQLPYNPGRHIRLNVNVSAITN